MSDSLPNPPSPLPSPSSPEFMTLRQSAPLVLQQSWEDRIFRLLMVLTVIGTAVAVNRGWITPEDAQTIRRVIPLSQQSRDDQAAREDAETLSERDAGLSESPDRPREFGPAEILIWLPVAEKLANLIKPIIHPPQPAPQPAPVTPPVNPPVNPVIPQVIPQPSPVFPPPDQGGARILLADDQGKPLSGAVAAGQLFQVAASVAPANAAWSVSRNGDVSLVTLAGNAGYVCSLRPGAWVEFHLVDFSTRQQAAARIVCNQGPQPPPVTPTPMTDTTTPHSRDLRVVIVYETTQALSRQQDAVLNSTVLASTLDQRCTVASDGRRDWRRWDKDTVVDPASTMGALFTAALPKAMGVGLPAIAVACGSATTVYPIPADVTESQILAVLACQ